jgi:arabinofuranosyltransferase
VAVVLGLVFTLAGVAAACAGAALLARARGSEGVLLPLGALVFAVLPPTWQFVTGGLETGLSFGWLGVSFLVLVRVCLDERTRSARRLALVAVLLGIGPLIRPDSLIFSAGFVAVLLAAAQPRPWRTRGLPVLAAAAALPLGYQLFRMGFFASLVPNTALAKEANGSYWSQGVEYLWDTVGTYWLFLPLAALFAWGYAAWRGDRLAGRRLHALLVAVPVVTGLLHVLFVVKVGGDFMHGRLLLPGLFALLMPVAVVAVPLRRLELALAAGVAVWLLVCGLALRVPYPDGVLAPDQVIVDERAYYAAGADTEHPVTLEDYGGHPFVRGGQAVRRRAQANPRVLTWSGPNSGTGDADLPDTPLAPGVPARIVAPAYNVGLFGYAAGPNVWVVDRLGLGDPIASRQDLIVRRRVGHEKLLPSVWILARFSDPARLPADLAGAAPVIAARRALTCTVWVWDGSGSRLEQALPETLTAITAPLTARRFASNVRLAATAGNLRVSADPAVAQVELCGAY